jgi:hypothetical protein
LRKRIVAREPVDKAARSYIGDIHKDARQARCFLEDVPDLGERLFVIGLSLYEALFESTHRC